MTKSPKKPRASKKSARQPQSGEPTIQPGAPQPEAAATQIPTGPPIILSVTPNQLAPGSTTNVTIIGDGLPCSVVAYSITNLAGQPVLGTGVQLVNCALNQVVLLVFLSPQISPGAYLLKVQNSFGSATAPIQVTGTVQPPMITSLDPNLIYVYQLQDSTLIVNGQSLPQDQASFSVRNSAGSVAPGFTLTLIAPSPTSAVIRLTINPSQVPTATYYLRVQNAAGSAASPFQIINFAKTSKETKEKETKETKETKEVKDKEDKESKDFKDKEKEKEKEKERKEFKEKDRKEFKDLEGLSSADLGGFEAASGDAFLPPTGHAFIQPDERPPVGEIALNS